MGVYQYKVKDSAGTVRTGQIKAPSSRDARNMLLRMRLRVISISNEANKSKKKKSKINFDNIVYRDKNGRIQIKFGQGKPTSKDIIVFTKQFATMINAGVALIQSIKILSQQQRSMEFGQILEELSGYIENGATLSQSLAQFPHTFDNLYVAMVRAGEVSGNLDGILLNLVSYIEKSEKVKNQVKAASYYPAVVVVVAVTVIAALLVFVVPTFAKQYSDSGKALPLLTQLVVDISDYLVGSWYLILGGIAGGVTALRMYIKTTKGRLVWDRLMLNIPGVGDLLRKIAVGRFCSIMSTMLTSGVNLLESLDICAGSVGNKVIENFVLGLRYEIEQGARLSDPMGKGGVFPPMVVSMVAVGETSGSLDEMLIKVSQFYEEEVDLAVKSVLSMIEPVMIVVIGSSVGFIVIAMYLPVFDMASLVGG